ncbi:hypothetical protein JCM8097_007531 [Rhodosporidiobolus ruineniae]
MASATSSSASTSNATGPRTDEEDKHSEEGAEEVKASCSGRLSLLDLPDELLVQVFNQVYHTVRAENLTDEKDGIPVPTSHIRINKRLYRLARPLWLRHLTSRSTGAMDRQLLHLYQHREDGLLILSAELDYPWKFPSVFTILIDLLPNLVTLTVHSGRLPGGRYASGAPSSVTVALASLRHLRHLVVPAWYFGDTAFDFSSAFPALRTLKMSDAQDMSTLPSPTPRVVLYALSSPQHWVPVFRTAHQLSLVPWEGGVYPHGPRIVEAFAEAVELQSQLPSAILPLEALSFHFPCLSHSELFIPDVFAPLHLFQTLEILQDSNLRRLEFSQVPHIIAWEPKSLRLESAAQQTLGYFLATFPNLRTLCLEGFQYSAAPEDQFARIIFPLDTSDPFFCFPSLLTLLAHLRSTSVTELRLRGNEERYEIRWTRRAREEDFEKELWHLW